MDKVSKVGKVFGRKEDDFDALESLNELDVSKESQYAGADAWILFRGLASEADASEIMGSIRKGNIVIADTSGFAKGQQDALENLVGLVRKGAEKVDGDIAKIAQDKIIVTPKGVKIKRKH